MLWSQDEKFVLFIKHDQKNELVSYPLENVVYCIAWRQGLLNPRPPLNSLGN